MGSEMCIRDRAIMAFSADGQVIKLSPDDIRTAGRDTQGVRIMRLGEGDKIVGAVCIQ